VFAYIREQPRDFVPTTLVDRNAMIWHAVHAALDAMGVPGPAPALTEEERDEQQAQAHLDALAPIAEGMPLPDGDGPALYEKLVGMFGGPLPWPPVTQPVPGDSDEPATVLRRVLADVVPVSGPGGAADETTPVAASAAPANGSAGSVAPGDAADETQQPVPVDRAAIRAAAFGEAAAKLAGLDPVKAALAGQHAWNVAAGIVRHMAVQERRMADGEQQPAPPVEHCIHDRTVHRTHHTAPVTGCPWCTAATSTEA
jgi:hypothetical protein